MGASCSNLRSSNDVCDLYKCIDSVSGIASNSQSPIDTWILNFKNGTRYDNFNVEKGFAKISISRRSLENTNTKCNIDNLIGIEYEINIYKYVIKPLIDRNICPNFIMYYSSGECSYENLRNMLAKNKPIPEENLIRNITMIANCLLFRPAINDDEHIDFEPDIIPFNEEWRYNILINSTMKSFQTFLQYIEIRGENFLNSKDPLFSKDLKILFQIFAGCYAMSLSKMVHNDLHLNNIFIENIEEQDVSYQFFGTYYTFRTDVKVKIYDFDNSYVQRFGPNPSISRYLCDTYSYCNVFTDNFDIITVLIKIFINISKQINSTQVKTKLLLYPIFMKLQDSETINVFKTMVKNGYIKDEDGSIIEELDRFNSTGEIILNFCQMLERKNIVDVSYELKNFNQDSIFICEPEMFNQNGTII